MCSRGGFWGVAHRWKIHVLFHVSMVCRHAKRRGKRGIICQLVCHWERGKKDNHFFSEAKKMYILRRFSLAFHSFVSQKINNPAIHPSHSYTFFVHFWFIIYKKKSFWYQSHRRRVQKGEEEGNTIDQESHCIVPLSVSGWLACQTPFTFPEREKNIYAMITFNNNCWAGNPRARHRTSLGKSVKLCCNFFIPPSWNVVMQAEYSGDRLSNPIFLC